MTKQENKEILLTVFAFIALILILFLVTAVHELGHCVTTLLLGGSVQEIKITLFDGGYIISQFPYEPNLYIVATQDFLVRFSGGLAVALFFLFLGFFKRPFLLIVPFQLLDGIIEATSTSNDMRVCIMEITTALLLLIYVHVFKTYVWDKELIL